MPSCNAIVNSESYAAFIYRHSNVPLEALRKTLKTDCFDIANQEYAIAYAPLEEVLPISLRKAPYATIPKLYSLMDTTSMEASGILPAMDQPFLNLRGEGALIGIIDTGIDYQNPLFLNPDGTTRILGIWDQTVKEAPFGISDPNLNVPILYGREYKEAEINAALASDSPLSIVPVTDQGGHGTFMAGIAAGNNMPEEDFTGAAPACKIGIVKLNPAKEYLRDFFLIRDGATAFQENDIMMAINYLILLAKRHQMPLSILIGLGTNQGSHNGTSPLGLMLRDLSNTVGIIASVPAGNETGYQHHYFGEMDEVQEYDETELRVDTNEKGFCLELWAKSPEIYTVGFVSPTGQIIQRIPLGLDTETTIPFLLEDTLITVNQRLTDVGSGGQLIFMRFQNPTPGIWKIRTYNSLYISGKFHMWLPVHGFLSDETVFLNPNPDTTVTDPGNSSFPITTAAYNHVNNSIYIHSSRGFGRLGQIKPDLTAPGVAVYGPGSPPSAGTTRALPGSESAAGASGSMFSFTRNTGTSIAAAHMAGAVADLLSWGIVQGNDYALTEASIKAYLIRGADRNPAYSYPSKEWGYGTLNLYQTFLRIR